MAPYEGHDERDDESGESLIDRLCDEFEEAWRANQRPRIEEYLTRVGDKQRSHLQEELLGLQHYWQDQQTDALEDNAAVQASASLISQQVGKYRIVREIDRGGMGCVYEAEHIHMQRRVAVKMISKQLLGSREAARRFRREVLATAKLSHPNIVTAHDADEVDGQLFLVMELVEGENLRATVKRRGPLPVADAIDWVMQAAQALQYAHNNGVIHRDVKPSNLILSPGGVIKLLDLGLARVQQSMANSYEETGKYDITNSECALGTVDFMAPEQAFDPKNIDVQADIYGLGCTLFYLVTGRIMFEGDTPVAKIVAHRDQPPPSMRTFRADIPAGLGPLFDRMVAKKPSDRYTSMDEVLQELQALRQPHKSNKPKTSLAVWWKYLAAAAVVCAIAGGIAWATWPPHTDRIGIQSNKGPPNLGAETDAPQITQRAVAEWVLSVGGSVDIRVAGEEVDFLSVGDTGTTDVEITAVDLSSLEGVTDTDLARFANTRQLENIQLAHTGVRGPGLEHLGGIDTLTHLNLGDLELEVDALRHLSQLPRLHALWLHGITNAHLERLGTPPELHYLWLDRSQVDDEGMPYIAKLSQLGGLGLGDTRVTDDGVAKLKSLQRLDQLLLPRTQVTAKACQAISGLKKLRGLNLAGTRCAGPELGLLSELDQLETLDLSESNVGDENLIAIQSLKQLGSLDLQGTAVSPTALAELQKALPNCQVTPP